MGCLPFKCERGDSNPHGVTTRTSNVLVYHSNTLANMLKYYNGKTPICQYFFGNSWLSPHYLRFRPPLQYTNPNADRTIPASPM